jgi:hypothetical protein
MQSVSFCYSAAKVNDLQFSYSHFFFITEFITLPLQCEQHSALASVYMECEQHTAKTEIVSAVSLTLERRQPSTIMKEVVMGRTRKNSPGPKAHKHPRVKLAPNVVKEKTKLEPVTFLEQLRFHEPKFKKFSAGA